MLEFMHMFNVYALHTDIALAYFYLDQSINGKTRDFFTKLEC